MHVGEATVAVTPHWVDLGMTVTETVIREYDEQGRCTSQVTVTKSVPNQPEPLPA